MMPSLKPGGVCTLLLCTIITITPACEDDASPQLNDGDVEVGDGLEDSRVEDGEVLPDSGDATNDITDTMDVNETTPADGMEVEDATDIIDTAWAVEFISEGRLAMSVFSGRERTWAVEV